MLKDDDFIMFESGAMVQYILDRHGNGQLQPKPGTSEHGLYLQWCWFAESTFARPIGEIVNHRRVFKEHQQSDAAINEMKDRASLCFKALDEAIEGREFLVGNEFTAADIMMGYSMFILINMSLRITTTMLMIIGIVSNKEKHARMLSICSS